MITCVIVRWLPHDLEHYKDMAYLVMGVDVSQNSLATVHLREYSSKLSPCPFWPFASPCPAPSPHDLNGLLYILTERLVYSLWRLPVQPRRSPLATSKRKARKHKEIEEAESLYALRCLAQRSSFACLYCRRRHWSVDEMSGIVGLISN